MNINIDDEIGSLQRMAQDRFVKIKRLRQLILLSVRVFHSSTFQEPFAVLPLIVIEDQEDPCLEHSMLVQLMQPQLIGIIFLLHPLPVSVMADQSLPWVVWQSLDVPIVVL